MNIYKNNKNNLYDYIRNKYDKYYAEYYIYLINKLMIFTLTPNMIIDFFEKQNILELSKNNTYDNMFIYDENKYIEIFNEIYTSFTKYKYGKFIPSNKIIMCLYKYIENNIVCYIPLKDDDNDFIRYFFNSKNIKLLEYNHNNIYNTIILYEEDKYIINEINYPLNIIIIQRNVRDENYIIEYLIDSGCTMSLLSEYKVIKVYNSYKNIHNSLILNLEQSKKFNIYFNLYNKYIYLSTGYFNEAIKLLLILINFKINYKKKNNHKILLNYLTNVFYPEIKNIYNNDQSSNGKLFVKYLRDYYLIREYSWSYPDLEILNIIIDFVKNRKVLEISAGIGLWSYFLKFYNVDIISTNIKDNYYHCSEYNWIDDWTYIDNLSSIKAFKKYNDREILFICWGPDNDKSDQIYFSIKSFQGKYMIIIQPIDTTLSFNMPEIKYYNKLIFRKNFNNIPGINEEICIYEFIYDDD